MKKILLFSLLGLFALCATGCQSKEDTCCLVTISANSDATIEEIFSEKTLGYYPGKYYIPYGKSFSVVFAYMEDYGLFTGKKTISAWYSIDVYQMKELDVTVGSYYKDEYSSEPTPCVWIAGKRVDAHRKY